MPLQNRLGFAFVAAAHLFGRAAFVLLEIWLAKLNQSTFAFKDFASERIKD
jgi:hypothetical protein